MTIKLDKISYLEAEIKLLTIHYEKLLEKFIEIASDQKISREIASNAQSMAQEALIAAKAPSDVNKALDAIASSEDTDWDLALTPSTTAKESIKPSPRLAFYSDTIKKVQKDSSPQNGELLEDEIA